MHNCWMQTRILRIASAAVVLLWAHSAAAQTADEIIEKSITAMGGRAAMEKVKSRQMTGTLLLGTPAGDIQGITETVVRDTVYVDGEIAEDTYDWFAQDKDGNVWYLGEDTHEYEDGKAVNADGAWEYGKDGALPGIVMLADPAVGDAYRQEYYEGEAEDMGEVLEVGVTAEIELGSYEDVLVTEDWNPLEPDVVEEKSYAPGIGLIREEKTVGGEGIIELIEFTPA